MVDWQRLPYLAQADGRCTYSGGNNSVSAGTGVVSQSRMAGANRLERGRVEEGGHVTQTPAPPPIRAQSSLDHR